MSRRTIKERVLRRLPCGLADGMDLGSNQARRRALWKWCRSQFRRRLTHPDKLMRQHGIPRAERKRVLRKMRTMNPRNPMRRIFVP